MLLWKNNKYYIFWVHVCNFIYPGCRAYASYCHMWGLSGCKIFFHIIPRRHDFQKTFIGRKMWVFISSAGFFLNISRYRKNSWRYHKCTLKYRLFLSYFNETLIFLGRFDVCLTCIIDINIVEEQLDATITIYLYSNQLNMFREIFCPSAGAQDCVLQLVV